MTVLNVSRHRNDALLNNATFQINYVTASCISFLNFRLDITSFKINTMHKPITITINDDRKIFAIRKEFNTAFPDLQIEFFGKAHSKSGAPSKKIIKSGVAKISSCRTTHSEGHLEINPEMTVSELCGMFRDKYDISVQLFCKSENKMIEFPATETWTLNKQNTQCETLNTLDMAVAQGNWGRLTKGKI